MYVFWDKKENAHFKRLKKDFSAPSYSCMVQFVLLHCTGACNRHFVSLEMQRAWSALQTVWLNQDGSLCHTVKSRNRGEPCTYGRKNDYYSIKTKTIKKNLVFYLWCDRVMLIFPHCSVPTAAKYFRCEFRCSQEQLSISPWIGNQLSHKLLKNCLNLTLSTFHSLSENRSQSQPVTVAWTVRKTGLNLIL